MPRRRIGLVWSLLTVMLATSLIPLLVTAYALIEINREGLESARREHELQIATSIASRLDAVVIDARRLLAAAAVDLQPAVRITQSSAGVRGGTARAALATYLRDEIVLLRYTSLSGSMAQVGSIEGFDGEAVQEGLFAGFATAMEGEGPVVVPIRLRVGGQDANPRPGAVVAAPVFKGGRRAGVVAAVVDLEETWSPDVGGVGSDYAVFLMDPQGEVLASANLPADLPTGTLRKLEIVRRFLTSDVKISEAMPLSVPGTGLFRKELLGASAPTEAGWGLFVLLDRSLAYHAAEEMRWQVVRWSTFAVALAVIAAVVSAGLVTRPLKVLVDGARRLGRGEFGKTVEVRSRSEIGELADTFNRMAEEIQNHIAGLNAAAEENQQLLLGSIRALAAAIDEKDPYTRGHSGRVHRFSVAIARHMGLSKNVLQNVVVGALLHDVGKIGIEDAILRKPSALTDEEFRIMKLHPEKGAHIMGSIPQMKEMIGAIRNHHERWSGGGYPDDLKGERIPLVARIIQVADSFDAMTTTRPYQRAMKPEAGVARIRELAGIVFDPKVVDAFHEAWIAGEIKVESRPVPRSAERPKVEVGS